MYLYLFIHGKWKVLSIGDFEHYRQSKWIILAFFCFSKWIVYLMTNKLCLFIWKHGQTRYVVVRNSGNNWISTGQLLFIVICRRPLYQMLVFSSVMVLRCVCVCVFWNSVISIHYCIDIYVLHALIVALPGANNSYCIASGFNWYAKLARICT